MRLNLFRCLAAHRPLRIAALMLPLALTACGGEQQELDQWMAEVRKNARPIDTRIDEPKKFEPYIYQEKAQLDPFNSVKITNALSRLAARNPSPLAPNPDRRREPLEAFPLDTIKMVGTLEKGSMRYALLRANGLLYQAGVGQYAGQNFGIITNISEAELRLREVVQDAAGEWIERVSTLELQESRR